ncbi:hypothetical protein [Agromyces sp. SYSU T0242]|uniref:hypothetical protein n=1 Tax=Agromyces litoreus TaxID=3158561 RepID=UPI003399AAA9
MIRTRGLAPAAIALLALLPLAAGLVACGAAPPAPAPADPVAPIPATPASASSPSQDAVDPLTAVTSVVAAAETLRLVAEGGSVIEEFSYLEDPEPVIATLTTLFDAEPNAVDVESTLHWPPATRYSWDDVEVTVAYWNHEPRTLASPRFRIEFTSPTSGDLLLTTPSGFRVGQSIAEVESELDPANWTCGGHGVDTVVVSRYSEDAGGMVDETFGVELVDPHTYLPEGSRVGDAVVVAIDAPEWVAGGCP